MVDNDVIRAVVQVSCLLSMIGSMLVAFTWAYPRQNRSKHARIILMWLSLTDFMTSIFYFFQTFGFQDNNEAFCKVFALIDIFFPVASFIWTVYVAYYIYFVIRFRGFPNAYQWNRMLIVFHVVAWTVSAIVIIVVASADHEGSSPADDTDDDKSFSNTGGWCWVTGSSRVERFTWEVIGGKFVEWLTCWVIVPLIYIATARELYSIDRQRNESTTPYDPRTGNSVEMASPFRLGLNDEEDSEIMRWSNVSGISAFSLHSETQSDKPSSQASSNATTKAGLFNAFYLKVAALPLVFIFVRFWSSLRVWLVFTKNPGASNEFLIIMQAFFDPSQGFFNALLFVIFSKNIRDSLLENFQNFFYEEIVPFFTCQYLRTPPDARLTIANTGTLGNRKSATPSQPTMNPMNQGEI